MAEPWATSPGPGIAALVDNAARHDNIVYHDHDNQLAEHDDNPADGLADNNVTCCNDRSRRIGRPSQTSGDDPVEQRRSGRDPTSQLHSVDGHGRRQPDAHDHADGNDTDGNDTDGNDTEQRLVLVTAYNR